MNIPDAPIVTLNIDGKRRRFDLDNPVLPSWVEDNTFASDGYPYKDKLKRKLYDKALQDLQAELVKVLYWLQESGERVIALFEGRDAAGKGGTIGAIRENLNPRKVRAVALSKPSDVEQGHWYYHRYVDTCPSKGEMVLFDRSWYNRAGVEPVMGFCTPEQHEKFLDETPDFERMITRDGIHFFKFWLTIGQEMQLKRFHDRRHSPVKYWKLSSIDIIGMQKWDDYTSARDTMVSATHSAHAPWTVIRMNDKRRGRLEVLRHILLNIDYEGKDRKALGSPDPKIIGAGPEALERD